jgi:hypothetical protein
MWCSPCYKRYRRYGDTTPLLPSGVIPQSSGVGLCSYGEGCANHARVRSNRLHPPKAQLQACREQLTDSGLCTCRLAGRCAACTVEGCAAARRGVAVALRYVRIACTLLKRNCKRPVPRAANRQWAVRVQAGGTNPRPLCISHGGGQRCSYPDCDRAVVQRIPGKWAPGKSWQSETCSFHCGGHRFTLANEGWSKMLSQIAPWAMGPCMGELVR